MCIVLSISIDSDYPPSSGPAINELYCSLKDSYAGEKRLI